METIGKYQVLDTIGSGGFSVVFKGYDPDIKRVVAIKVCALQDEESRARFYHEAEIAGRLSHRNITAIYEFGLYQQTPFLVEEYLPGADLAQLIQRREPEVLDEKLDILLQIASGLGYAHRQGVVHRDIKPANVRVLDNGRVKILDFGTAKISGAESGLTRSGMTLGTVAYLAPERLRGREAETTADIFSFGALAHELLAHQRAFAGNGIAAVIQAILEAPAPPIATRCSDCPPALAELVDRCLRPDPTQRYASGEELRIALEAFRETWHAPPDAVTLTPATAAHLAPVVVARVEHLLDEGRADRARLLLEEALEMSPEDSEIRRLATAQGMLATPTTAPHPADRTESERPLPDDDAHRQEEAAGSIQTLIDDARWVEAARALSFACRLFTTFAPAPSLAGTIVDRLRDAITEVRNEALRQAHHLAVTLRGLEGEGSLDADLAEHLAERAEDLAPGRTSAAEVARALRQRQAPSDLDRRTAEAIASIEQLLSAGEIEQAADALAFATQRYGTFARSEQLAMLIDHAQRAGQQPVVPSRRSS